MRSFVAGLGAVEIAHAVEHADMGSALISVGRHGVSTESGSDRVSLISKIRIVNNVYRSLPLSVLTSPPN